MNVNNARRNIPKDIKSLKSKRFFIGITSIPFEMKVTHPLPYGMYTIAGSLSATDYIISHIRLEHKFYL